MRNFVKNSSLALAAVLALSACGSKTTTPEAVALEFQKSITNLDFAKAKSLGDENTGTAIDMISGMMASVSAEDLAKAKEDAKKAVELVKTAKCTTTGDKATCTVCCDVEGKDGQPIELVQKDGKWIVSMKKETSAPAMESAPATEEALQSETTEEAAETAIEEAVETNNAE